MSESTPPRISRLPFLLADALFLGIAGYVCYTSERPLELWQGSIIFVSVAAGAWCSFIPFTKQFNADLKRAESSDLVDAVSQVRNIESVARQIQQATSQWQEVQEHAAKTSTAAKDVADRMTHEIKSFAGFMEKANHTERQHLRLEIEKLRRAESEWLQANVRILDHVFALYAAAVHSRQPALIEQIGQFQDTCVEALRRVGLTPFAPRPDEAYNPDSHNLPPNAPPIPAGTALGATLAPGFTYQGQLLRKPLVAPRPPTPQQPEPSQPSDTTQSISSEPIPSSASAETTSTAFTLTSVEPSAAPAEPVPTEPDSLPTPEPVAVNEPKSDSDPAPDPTPKPHSEPALAPEASIAPTEKKTETPDSVFSSSSDPEKPETSAPKAKSTAPAPTLPPGTAIEQELF